jgi:hypothetical protein
MVLYAISYEKGIFLNTAMSNTKSVSGYATKMRRLRSGCV